MNSISFARQQFPPDVIRHAVWLYLRFTLSLRDVEEMLAERGLDLTYETVRRWVAKFGPLFARELRKRRHRPTGRWHLDEMVVKIAGKRHWLWRAVDDEGEVLDMPQSAGPRMFPLSSMPPPNTTSRGFWRRAPTWSSTVATNFWGDRPRASWRAARTSCALPIFQNRGIGRGMKVGKESIVGVMAALEAWATRDHAGIRQRERAALDLWLAALRGLPGINAAIVPDPTDNPLDRLEVSVRPESGFTAASLCAALAAGDPPVIVRDHEIERGHFYLDPCNLHPGEAEIVASRLADTLRSSNSARAAEAGQGRGFESLLSWPD